MGTVIEGLAMLAFVAIGLAFAIPPARPPAERQYEAAKRAVDKAYERAEREMEEAAKPNLWEWRR